MSSSEPQDISSPINTLLQLKIDNDHNLQYYLPYLFKSDLLMFADTPKLKLKDITNLYSQEGCSLGCEHCSKLIKSECRICKLGFYLQQDSCVKSCNYPLIADNLRFKCVKPSTQDTIYYHAYSKSSCTNNYGRILTDCSCAPSCMQSGSCCYDFEEHNCKRIIDEGSKLSKRMLKLCKGNDNCEYCDQDAMIDDQILSCNQCRLGFFLHDGKCVKECPSGFIIAGSTCTKQEKCTSVLNNCLECNGSNQCNKCVPGSFLHRGACITECPDNFNADRVTWSCLESTVFTWHWVIPSKHSCKSSCSSSPEVNQTDCTCTKDCIKKGICCQDYETFCFASSSASKSNLRASKIKTLSP